jgi:hypothetical protein
MVPLSAPREIDVFNNFVVSLLLLFEVPSLVCGSFPLGLPPSVGLRASSLSVSTLISWKLISMLFGCNALSSFQLSLIALLV